MVKDYKILPGKLVEMIYNDPYRAEHKIKKAKIKHLHMSGDSSENNTN